MRQVHFGMGLEAGRCSAAPGALSLGEGISAGSFFRAPFETACRASGVERPRLADVLIRLASGRLRMPRMAGEAGNMWRRGRGRVYCAHG